MILKNKIIQPFVFFEPDFLCPSFLSNGYFKRILFKLLKNYIRCLSAFVPIFMVWKNIFSMVQILIRNNIKIVPIYSKFWLFPKVSIRNSTPDNTITNIEVCPIIDMKKITTSPVSSFFLTFGLHTPQVTFPLNIFWQYSEGSSPQS